MCICPSLLEKISTKQDIAFTDISYQYLPPKVPSWGELKPQTPVLQPIHFQLQRKSLYLVIYSSLFDLPSQSHGQLAIGDNEKNETIVIFSSSLSPSGKLLVRMWYQV